MASQNKETYSYTDSLQRKIVALLLYDDTALVTNAAVIKPEFFDNPILQVIVQKVQEHYQKYAKGPEQDELYEEVSREFVRLKIPVDTWGEIFLDVLGYQEEDFAYLKDKTRDFARYQAVKSAIIDSASILQKKRDYTAIVKLVEESLQIGEDADDLGSFYAEEIDERLEARKHGQSRRALAIPTGIRDLDEHLGGGIAPPELGIVMSFTKVGKTTTGANFAKGAMLAGYNVIHYGFEGSERETQIIYDSSISGVDRDLLTDMDDKVRDEITEFFKKAPKIGRLVVKHYPAKDCSALTVEAHIRNLKMRTGFEPDLIILDYLGLMASGQNIKAESSAGWKYFILGEIAKEIIALAQRRNIAVWLIHQTNRRSNSKVLIDIDDAGDSILPMQDANLILTLNQSKEEIDSKDNEQSMRIFIAGGRSVRDKRVVKVRINKAKCQIWSGE